MSELLNIFLTSNELTGTVPSTLGNIRSLENLVIDSNNLNGNLDFLASLSNCQQLQFLIISFNPFNGTLNPIYVGNLSTNLQIFEADNNQIIGGIPATLSNLTSLISIRLANNQLSQAIPVSLTTLDYLQELDLSTNLLSGQIPTQIGMLKQLVRLLLRENKISGSIPGSLANLTFLEVIDLSNNKLSSTAETSLFRLPNIIQLYAAHNFLSGTLPPDSMIMQAVNQMDISDNRFVGHIPDSFANCQLLIYLNLSHNSFDDSIPDSLHKLASLEALDLSFNNLSGTIPSYLANFSYLSSLNLSFNHLEGQVPIGGVFSNITLQALVGNVRLCGGAPSLGFSPCLDKPPHPTHRRRYYFLKFVLPAAVTIAVVGITFCVYLLMRIRRIKKPDVNKASIDMDDLTSHRTVSYYEILRATDNFSEDNQLGRGSFGKVFKGQLDDGMVVAIKVLDMQAAQAVRSFDAECNALRMARHRNLIRIITTCSNLDFRALLLQYMPNGSLEEHLHTAGSRPYMGFFRRLVTMLDVSIAMEYLHHGYYQVVLHCDLKPSNVLFDEEMTAHVADFGIAKLLLGDDCSVVSASMPGTLGYMAPGMYLHSSFLNHFILLQETHVACLFDAVFIKSW